MTTCAPQFNDARPHWLLSFLDRFAARCHGEKIIQISTVYGSDVAGFFLCLTFDAAECGLCRVHDGFG